MHYFIEFLKARRLTIKYVFNVKKKENDIYSHDCSHNVIDMRI